MFFNKYISKLKSYSVSSHKAWMIDDKSSVLKLDWNEATIPPTPKVKSALLKYAENGFMNWYPDIDNQILREKLANYCQVTADNVEYFASSDALHEYVIRTFINPSDVVTLIAPTYDNFRAAAESVGAKVDYYILSESRGFEFEFDDFSSHLETICPKVVYLCNPNNPTGTLYSIELIEKLIRRFNDVLFIIDEAYFEFTGISSTKLCTTFENIIVTRTFSKAFALASFRVGYAISSKHNILGLRKVRNPKNISSYAQIAAIEALNDLDYMNKYVESVNVAKLEFLDYLKNSDFQCFPTPGGNFVLVKFGVIQEKLVKYLEDNNVFVRNYGHVSGMSEYTRITVGTDKQMFKLKGLIDKFCKEIKLVP